LIEQSTGNGWQVVQRRCLLSQQNKKENFMKRNLFSLRAVMVALGSIVLMGSVLTACKKSLDGGGNNVAVARLMAFNLAPDRNYIGVAIDNNSLTAQPISYSNYTGFYINVYPGQRQLGAFDPNNDSLFTKNTVTLDTSKYYSLFVVGTGGAYKNVIVKDNFDSIPATSDQSFVRFINAVTDSVKPLTVKVAAGGNNVVNEDAVYGTVSGFVPVTPGEITVDISSEGGATSNRKFTLESKKIYTILLMGQPGATAADKQVQIRYINNGTL
jgi:hypothetical protein